MPTRDGIGDVPYEANDIVDRLIWKHPLVKLLLNSPAVQTLRLVAQAVSVAAQPERRRPASAHASVPSDWSAWSGRAASIELRGVAKHFGEDARGRRR